jgi:hypothetical protein
VEGGRPGPVRAAVCGAAQGSGAGSRHRGLGQEGPAAARRWGSGRIWPSKGGEQALRARKEESVLFALESDCVRSGASRGN